jgi:L-rhamnose-H+ transport protein
VKDWSWENFWLTQGIFAWLIFPLLGALLAIPENNTLLGIITFAGSEVVLKTIGYGVLWGIGGLTFGLSMRYLGVALGQSLALGTCSAFGVLIPALLKGESLFQGKGLILLIGVSLAVAGIAIIGYAGSLRSKNMSDEEKRQAVKDYALKKGLLIAILAGVMSACFNLGLEAGVKQKMVELNVSSLYAGLPATLLVTIGGFITNAVYCIYQNVKNKTGKQYFYVPGKVLINNLLFCALAGMLWYSQFFGFSIGQSFLEDSAVMMAFSWGILMALNVTFSNVWGILLKEWKGVSNTTIFVLIAGLTILVFSVIFPKLV